MRGLSLTQPWATLVAIGAKTIETRSWPTRYRGPIAIHAAKGFPTDDRYLCDRTPFRQALGRGGYERPMAPSLGTTDPEYPATRFWPSALPLGAIVAVADLVECVATEQLAAHQSVARAEEMAFGDYSPGRWGFRLDNVRALPEPIPCRGALGLWDVPAEIARQIGETP